MAAVLVAAGEGGGAHRLLLPRQLDGGASSLDEVRYALGESTLRGPLLLVVGAWSLTVPDLRAIGDLLASRGLHLQGVESTCPTTLVSAAAIGLSTHPPARSASLPEAPGNGGRVPLAIHRGPLRSGEHLQVDGSVLLLGDVNPGARISAGGHVLVWGRLRGIAHAGCHGDRQARIVALQLRPLQLRIADVVARGPAAVPPPGLSEEAHLNGDTILIDPARPVWPLSD